jgi:hypothetical protein
MARAADRIDADPAFEAAAVRILREMRLMRLLGTSADRAHQRYGASCLIVDRSANLDSAEIKAEIGHIAAVDLWDLDPILWDEANAAAMQVVPAGETSRIYPVIPA